MVKITMIEKLKQVFDGDLTICNIHKLTEEEYEIDTIGYNYYYSGWKIPMGTFSLMMDYGLHNIRIIKSKRVSSRDSYLITIRFTVDTERLKERLREDEEWRIRWEKLQKEKENGKVCD